MKSIFFLLALTALVSACEPARPDCTIQETASGGLVPYGDCDDCDTYTIINTTGGQRPMTTVDAERFVNANPPSANYNPSSPSLSDFMLYHYLLSGPRATHYQTVYAPQFNSYSGYQRSHPGYVMPRRYVNRTTVVNKTIINNRVVNRSRPTITASPKRSWGMAGGTTRTFGTSRSTTSSRPSSWGSSSRSYSSPSRSSFRSSSSSSRSYRSSNSTSRRR